MERRAAPIYWANTQWKPVLSKRALSTKRVNAKRAVTKWVQLNGQHSHNALEILPFFGLKGSAFVAAMPGVLAQHSLLPLASPRSSGAQRFRSLTNCSPALLEPLRRFTLSELFYSEIDTLPNYHIVIIWIFTILPLGYAHWHHAQSSWQPVHCTRRCQLMAEF